MPLVGWGAYSVLADKMYVDTYKEWIPDNKENELLEGAVPLPCQGECYFPFDNTMEAY